MRKILIAAFSLALAAPAWADNDGSAGCIGGGFGIVVSTCEIDVGNGKIGTDELANGAVTEGKLNAPLAAKINGKADTTYVDSENAAQDAAIDLKADKANTYTKSQVNSQNAVQNFHIGMNYLWNGYQQGQISDLQDATAQHGARLDHHEALLSQHASTLANHGARLGEVERGLAIAMAMPDAWLSDKDHFAVAGNIGGFNGETALGFAGIARIDQTWSLNSKIGTDVEFKEFGWTVGARAGW